MGSAELIQCYRQADPLQPLTADQAGKITSQLDQYHASISAYTDKLRKVSYLLPFPSLTTLFPFDIASIVVPFRPLRIEHWQ